MKRKRARSGSAFLYLEGAVVRRHGFADGVADRMRHNYDKRKDVFVPFLSTSCFQTSCRKRSDRFCGNRGQVAGKGGGMRVLRSKRILCYRESENADRMRQIMKKKRRLCVFSFDALFYSHIVPQTVRPLLRQPAAAIRLSRTLPTPQIGQTQSSGRSSNAVPGAMPFSGSPTAGSYS